MAECYAVVQWTSAKVTSLGIIAESECQSGEFEVGASIQANYRSSVYEAKILFIGELDLMSHKLASLKSSYKSSSTNSPRGRGHRTVKKKVLEDFIQPSDTLSKEKEEKTDKFSKKTQNSLKRKATDDTGDAIIAKLLCQESESSGDEFADDVEALDNEEDFVATLKRELTSSKEEIRRLQKTISELKEQNDLLQKGLPDLAVQLQAAISTLGKVARPSHSVLAIPATPRKTPPALKLPVTPVTPPSTTPEIVLSDSENGFIIDEEILRRAGSAKSWGALVCNLMSALFKREEMANACLTEKQAAKTGKRALPADKVDAVIQHVLKTYSNADVAAIRIKMSTKLRDERNAFQG
ncbi:hypothetical protein HOLleu_43598 [Holothuria leucospilota]|uniref:BEN domain-containing protein n=1 Tax=Holothuria leucospilota TaxID=206669 RepID=A0A9Q1BAZ6_HOLLE|nr:hypothetical protein HOLleu_43598 [Holothuria leucospilota]